MEVTMVSNFQTTIVYLVMSALALLAQIEPINAQAENRNEAADRDQDNLAAFLETNGTLFCGPLTNIPDDTKWEKIGKLNANIELHKSARLEKAGKIKISRSMLNEIFRWYKIEGMSHRSDTGSYLYYIGKAITSYDDIIVANFENNAQNQTNGQASGLRNRASRFFGYKILLGRHFVKDDAGMKTAFNVFFRLIINVTDQSIYSKSGYLKRAAIVISQIPISNNGPPIQEKFHRFPPTGRPFRMLICTTAGGRNI
jgi:hypothetical protein